MTSLFSSDIAIAALAALRQRGEPLALAEIARAVDSPLSSAQKALRLLRDSGVVVADTETRPRYTVSGASVAAVEHLVLAALGLGQHRVLDAALRASGAVEFAARDPDGLLVVTRFDADIEDEARLEQLLASAGVRARVLHHDDVRDEVEADGGLRARARATSVIVGSVDRSFPDPGRRGSLSSPFLGRLHPDLERPRRSRASRGTSGSRSSGSSARPSTTTSAPTPTSTSSCGDGAARGGPSGRTCASAALSRTSSTATSTWWTRRSCCPTSRREPSARA